MPSSVECHQLLHWDKSHTSASRPWSWPPVKRLKTKSSIQRLFRKFQSYAVMFLMTLCEIKNNGRKRLQILQTFSIFSNLPLQLCYGLKKQQQKVPYPIRIREIKPVTGNLVPCLSGVVGDIRQGKAPRVRKSRNHLLPFRKRLLPCRGNVIAYFNQRKT